MKAQRGFTLIELVVVIIVLGILAVTAAPKFIDLQSDARAATVQGLKGALQGANGLVYAKSAVKGAEGKNCKTETCVAIEVGSTADVNPIYGNAEGTFDKLKEVAELDASEWDVNQFDGDDTGAPAVGTIYITPKGVKAKFSKISTGDEACQLIYKQASKSGNTITQATYTAVVGGC